MLVLCDNYTMPENQCVEYSEVAAVLHQASIPVDAADCHGFLTGLICAAGFADPGIWVAEIFEDYNPANALQAETFRQLQRLYLDEPGEDELAALEEVVEYIRVGVLYLHDELQPAIAPPQVQ